MTDHRTTDRQGAVMNATVVRYRVKPDRAEENADLVRAVYAELAELAPPAFRYATFAEDDGASFVHVAFVEDGEEAPLPRLAAFRRFQEGLGDRCEEAPVVTRAARQIGSYGL
jgi:hypothetical protein